VVAASLLGSILSNLLLVLGCCFLLGGARNRLQSFNQLATRVGRRRCQALLRVGPTIALPHGLRARSCHCGPHWPAMRSPSAAGQVANPLQASASLLFLSCIGIVLPTAADRLLGDDEGMPFEDVLLISRITALGLLATWVALWRL
jgi:hypothetical protein